MQIADGASSNIVGGIGSESGNDIAFNLEGVVLSGSATVGDSILGNSIFGNTSRGIDLGSSAANDGQAAPQLTSLATTSYSTTVKGSLTSSPGTYRLEFFASPLNGPTSQGKTTASVIWARY